MLWVKKKIKKWQLETNNSFFYRIKIYRLLLHGKTYLQDIYIHVRFQAQRSIAWSSEKAAAIQRESKEIFKVKATQIMERVCNTSLSNVVFLLLYIRWFLSFSLNYVLVMMILFDCLRLLCLCELLVIMIIK